MLLNDTIVSLKRLLPRCPSNCEVLACAEVGSNILKLNKSRDENSPSVISQRERQGTGASTLFMHSFAASLLNSQYTNISSGFV